MFELQRLAAEIVGRVLSGRSLDTQRDHAVREHEGLKVDERGALRDITSGTLRFLGELDSILEQLLNQPLKHERVRQLLRVALYQLIHTRVAAHVIVDQAVKASVAAGGEGAKGLVNAVLRRFLRERESLLAQVACDEVGRYSHPAWWIEKVKAQHPEHYETLLSHGNTRPPLTLRINSRRSTPECYVARLREARIDARSIGGMAVVLERPMPTALLPGFAEGLVSVQDASAQEAAAYLDMRAGQRVLDACAAPGGKAAHIMERAEVDLTAIDNDPGRLARVEANLTRLELHARVQRGDAAQPEKWWDGVEYDRIVADVPCSGSGVVRRHPDIKWLRRPSDIDAYAERQRAILESLWQLLRRDGKLLYVTCSVFVEENDDQIKRFLERHHDARRLSLPGPETNAQRLKGQILPDETHDGFFYALLQKS